MPARIRHITIDCRDPYALSRFWSAALGFVDHPDEPNRPDDPEAVIVDPKGLHPGLLFIPVPEDKTTKNRIHLDVVPDTSRDEEVVRLIALGATEVADHRTPDGRGWVVLADPEGNEFCVERSRAERDQPGAPSTGERSMHHLIALDERPMLEGLLEWYREGVELKLADASKWTADGQPLTSPSSVGGMVKHLAIVEDWWFTVRFEGRPIPEIWEEADAAFDEDPDWEFHTAHQQSIEELLSIYRTSCDRSRAVAAAHALDDVGADRERGAFTLRWVLLHLIEETARHLGHMDILRELLDGATGE